MKELSPVKGSYSFSGLASHFKFYKLCKITDTRGYGNQSDDKLTSKNHFDDIEAVKKFSLTADGNIVSITTWVLRLVRVKVYLIYG